jgi:hypothetical protein
MLTLGCELKARGGSGFGGGCVERRSKSKAMASFPVLLGDNKKGMVEKGESAGEEHKDKGAGKVSPANGPEL